MDALEDRALQRQARWLAAVRPFMRALGVSIA
jgi:hypothetical protein